MFYLVLSGFLHDFGQSSRHNQLFAFPCHTSRLKVRSVLMSFRATRSVGGVHSGPFDAIGSPEEIYSWRPGEREEKADAPHSTYIAPESGSWKCAERGKLKMR